MTQGSIPRGIVRFSLPLIAAYLLQRGFNTADIVVVGRFVNDDALAAVTSTSSLIMLLISVFSYLSMGTNVTAARAFGAGNTGKVSRVVHTSILLALWGGAVVAVFGAIFTPVLLRWMASPERIIGQSTLYMRLYFLGIPATMLYNFGSALLRSGGDTKRPTVYLTVSGMVNVVLNLLFVLVFRMSVAGVALATAITQWLSAALVLRALTRETGALRLNPRGLHMDRECAGEIVKIGLPAGVQGLLISLSNVVVQSSINSLGEAAMAGSGAAADINAFVDLPMCGFYQACLTITGQNLGAGQLKRVDSVRRWALLFSCSTGIVLGSLVCLLSRPLLGIYISAPDAIAVGETRLLIETLFVALCGTMDIFVGNMRGMGMSVPPMIISLLGVCAFRSLWIAIVFSAYHTPQALFLVYPVSWTLTSLMQGGALIYTRRRVFAQTRAETAQSN